MQYFDFNQLNLITRFFNNSSLQDQFYSYEKWFNFHALVEKQDKIESFLILIPLSLLFYCWIVMFRWYDRT